MEIPTVQIGSRNRMGRDSEELRRRSRIHGRLPETVMDEECSKCGRTFVPANQPAPDSKIVCPNCRRRKR
jgi:formylmethanofuran dehydrogenase subunit E